MANKKSGRIAVPFLVTVFIGLILVGGAAWYIFTHFINKTEEPPMPPARIGGVTATAEDSHTILFVLNTPDKQNKNTFVILRSVPELKKLLIIGVPSNTIAIINSEQKKLSEVYSIDGVKGAEAFITATLGIDIDRYMELDSEKFCRICDMFGGVSYPVDVEIPGLQPNGTEQIMDANQILMYVTYPMFVDGEFDRATNTAVIIQKMINGADGERIASRLDTYFEELINNAQSDITSRDYDEHSSAIKYMFSFGKSIASSSGVNGKTYDADFIPSAGFLDSLPEEFFGKTDEASTESEN